MIVSSCSRQKEHTSVAINEQDSVSMMVSYGVNTIISDSGIMKYRIVAEEWEVNTVRNPSRWIFNKGIFMEQFDQQFHIEAFVQADTAFYYDQKNLWELRGRVRIRTVDGIRFSSEELFWDQQSHEFYSHMFSHVITPEREMQGSYFRSDEQMNKYMVTNSKGSFENAHFGSDESTSPATTPAGNNGQPDPMADSIPKRQPTTPFRQNK